MMVSLLSRTNRFAKEKEDIEKTMQAASDGQPKEVDPNDLYARIQVVDSHNGPPTAHPDEFATIVPGPMLPIPEDADPDEPPPPEQADSTGATAGAPGTWTPADSTAPADFAGLASHTASPTTPWASGEYVVLGDRVPKPTGTELLGLLVARLRRADSSSRTRRTTLTRSLDFVR